MGTALSNQISNDLLKRIKSGEFVEKIPSERDLAARYEVSRNVIRESIKILSEMHLITNIPGKGNFITKPTETHIANNLETSISLSDIKLRDIIDAREFLELGVSEKYLLAISNSDLAKLEKLYDLMEKSKDDYETFWQYDKQFHLHLIACSHNSILSMFLSTLYNMTIDKNIIVNSVNPKRVIKFSQQGHLDIIESIKSKDEARLKKAIIKHIDPLRDFYNISEGIPHFNHVK